MDDDTKQRNRLKLQLIAKIIKNLTYNYKK